MDDYDKLDDFDANECVDLINSIISQCGEIRCSMTSICDFFNLHPFIESKAAEKLENENSNEANETGKQSVDLNK